MVFDKFSLELIKNSIRRERMPLANHQFNLRWSLLEYLNPERKIGERMKDCRQLLREHMNSDVDTEWEFSSDAEYCYAVGQAVSYMLSLSKMKNKTDAFINPYLNAKSADVIKMRLEQLYKNTIIVLRIPIMEERNSRFLHLMVYEPEQILTEYIMAGFTARSLIYEKNENSN